MFIRHATIDDASAMGEVMVETYMLAHKGHMPKAAWQKRAREWTPEVSARGWADYLRDRDEAIRAGRMPDSCLYLAVDEATTTDSGIVGLIHGYPSEAEGTAEISTIYVKQSHQGQGLGRRLMQAVATHMAGIGYTKLQLGVFSRQRISPPIL